MGWRCKFGGNLRWRNLRLIETAKTGCPSGKPHRASAGNMPGRHDFLGGIFLHF